MKSLKIKFSIVVGLTIITVLMIFSTLIFASSIQNKEVITPDVLVQFPGMRPGLRRFLIETERISDIAEVAEIVQEEQRAEYFRNVMFITAGLTILSVISAYFIASYLLKPISELNKDIRGINPNDLSQRVREDYNAGEIQFLANSFNHLLGNLDEAFKNQEQFIQDAAHELRTPIAAIKSNIDTAKRKKGSLSREEFEYLVETIERLNDRLVQLNENLLFLNRKTDKSSYKKTNINALIEDISESLIEYAKEKDVELRLDLCKEKVFREVHAQQFSQAITNIIQNGIKYSRDNVKSKVTIRTAYDTKEDKFMIVIKDNGIGISKKDINSIFERFYRSNNARDKNGEGEGLGLAISKKILDEHGASIKVESRLNRGTKFIIEM